MSDRIVGICRFSFLGRGDWIGMRGQGVTKAGQLERRAGLIYAPDRLARRFAAFQTMLLPSIAAQTDGDFQLWILTSPELPAQWMARLRALCAPVPQIRIIVSAERSTADALAGPLAEATDAAGGPIIQFRVDDDDALSQHFIGRLRAHMRRFDDLPTIALSMPRGVILRSFDREPLSCWFAFQPFIGIGAAVRLSASAQSVFLCPRSELSRHFPSFSDPVGLSYVNLRWEEGDSAARDKLNWDGRHVPIDPVDLANHLAEDFPFLIGADLDFITQSRSETPGGPAD